MNYIKKFDEISEDIEIVDQFDIEISKFDNELTDRENWDLYKWSDVRNFSKDDVNKLNYFFGVYKTDLRKFMFKLDVGGFGRERINFSGCINKKSEYDNDGKKLIDDVYFLIDGYIKVKFGEHSGERKIFLKFAATRPKPFLQKS
jgi:hypothetical protein